MGKFHEVPPYIAGMAHAVPFHLHPSRPEVGYERFYHHHWRGRDYYFAYCPDLPEATLRVKPWWSAAAVSRWQIASILRNEGSCTRGSI